MTADPTPRSTPAASGRETARNADYRIRLMIEAMVRDDRTEEEIVDAVRAMTAEQRRAA
jgi:hypothetical protein